jgi:hypothetical protein
MPNLPQHRVLAILEDASGSLWFGGYDTEISRLKDSKLETFSGPNPTTILSFCAEEKEALWVGTSAGLWLCKSTEFSRPPALEGALASEAIECLLRDRENNIWIGTGNGLYCVEPKVVSTFTSRNGLGPCGLGLLEGLLT